jgi:hypothetical protein
VTSTKMGSTKLRRVNGRISISTTKIRRGPLVPIWCHGCSMRRQGRESIQEFATSSRSSTLVTTLILLLSDIPHTALAIEEVAQYHQFFCP